jgi:putative transposase
MRQMESRATVIDISHKLGITETRPFRRKARYTGLGVNELRELRELREENRRLKRMVADLTLDKMILRGALGASKW